MPSYDTYGHDAVLELGEIEIDEFVACRFATGAMTMPKGGTFELESADATVDLRLLFDTPWTRLVADAGPRGNEPGVRLVAPFDEAYARALIPVSFAGITRTEEVEFVDLRGQVYVTAPIRTRDTDDGDTIAVFVDTKKDALTVEVVFQNETRQRLDRQGQDLLNRYRRFVEDPDPELEQQLQDLPATVKQQVAGVMEEADGAGLPSFPLDVPVHGQRVDVRTVDGETTSDRCLLILIELADDPEGQQPHHMDACARPEGTTAAVALSSNHILSSFVRGGLAEGFDISEDRFDYPCTLSERTDTTVEVDGTDEQITLERLEASIEDAQIVIRGRISTTKKNADVIIDFTTRLDVDYGINGLSLSVADVDTSAEVDLPWYLDIVSFWPVVGKFGVLSARELIEKHVAKNFSKNIREDEDLTDAQKANELLRDQLGRMSVETFSLDEESMILAGSFLSGRGCEPAAEGTIKVPPGGRVDLDEGRGDWQISYVADGDIDLVWQTEWLGARLAPRNGARIGTIGTGPWFGPGTPLTLEAKDDDWWSTDPIRRARVPKPWVSNILPGPEDWFQFGVRTSEGRYAKCGVRLASGGALELRFHTFQRPVPEVELGAVREVLEEEQVGSGTDTWGEVNCHEVPSGRGFGGGFGAGSGLSAGVGIDGGTPAGGMSIEQRSASYKLYERAFRIRSEATTRLLAYPLDVVWSLGGKNITGQGSVTIDDHTITHDASGRTCTLETEKGKPLKTWLEARITDERGLDFVARHHFDIPETIKEGGMPPGAAQEQEREIARCAAAQGDGDGPRPREIGQGGEGARLDPEDLGRDGARPDPRRINRRRSGLALRGRSGGRQTLAELQRALDAGLGRRR